MKNLNKKGFTLIELLAVIVVLAIILVITVPTVLNTLTGTRKDALDASAASAADFYRNQIALKTIDSTKGETGFITDFTAGTAKAARCITTTEATVLGISGGTDATSDYIIGTDTSTCSTVSWTNTGSVTVILKTGAKGKFSGTSSTATK